MNNPFDWASEQIDNLGDNLGNAWDDFTGATQAKKSADAVGQAAAQDRAYAHPNVNGPLGSQTVTTNPDGTISVNTALSPEQQGLVSSLYGDLGTGRQRVEDALYSNALSRLDPQWQQSENQTRTRLYNMGLTEGDEAYQREMDRLSNAKQDAYSSARNQSIAAGGAEQSRLINALMASANPGLASYWGNNNATQGAIAQQNLLNSTPTGLDAILGSLAAIFGG